MVKLLIGIILLLVCEFKFFVKVILTYKKEVFPINICKNDVFRIKNEFLKELKVPKIKKRGNSSVSILDNLSYNC